LAAYVAASSTEALILADGVKEVDPELVVKCGIEVTVSQVGQVIWIMGKSKWPKAKSKVGKLPGRTFVVQSHGEIATDSQKRSGA
jgi:hypothetical protein